MKIFNWMHKRFHHSTLKDGFVANIQDVEPATNNVDSQAFLKQVVLPDLIGGWKDGILTIGTLGYESFNQNKEYFALEGEDELEDYEGEHILVEEENYNSEHEELNPLMHSTFEHNFEDFVSSIKEEVVKNFNGVVLTPPVILNESKEIETDEKRKNWERITLADLFFDDSDVNLKPKPAKVLPQSSLKANHGLSFTKKLIPRVKGNPHPIKDIKKLMKKMLKRKIHPEFDVDNHKLEGQKASSAGSSDNHKKHEANDLTFLIPI